MERIRSITQSRLDKLEYKARLLDTLHSYGVKEWESYSDALEDFKKEYPDLVQAVSAFN